MYLLDKRSNLFTTYQTQTLMKRLQNKLYLEKGEKHQLAKLLDTSDVRIERWFNRRRTEIRQAGLLAKGEECLTK